MLIVELLNTAIEIVVDRISPDFHEVSGREEGKAEGALESELAAVRRQARAAASTRRRPA